MSDALALALAAESEQRWVEALELCLKAMQAAPQDPDVLNLLGRLCQRAGDLPQAVAVQAYALHLDPTHERAERDLAAALLEPPSSPEAARAKLAEAIALAPDVTSHQRHPMSLLPFAGMDRIEASIRESLKLDCASAEAHAALANVQSRRRQRLASMLSYEIAVRLRFDFAEAHLALASLYEAQHYGDRAELHWRQAMARKRVYPSTHLSTDALRVLFLAVPRAAMTTPLDFFLNPSRTELVTYYLVPGAPPPERLPEYDVVFTGIEESEFSTPSIAMATAFVATQRKPAINDPACLAGIGRTALAQTLSAVAGCSVPPTRLCSRTELLAAGDEATGAAGIEFPLLVRPIDTHSGRGMERIRSVAELRDYLARHHDDRFHLSPFVDYRSADGYFRKYRVVVVDGIAYPYHLAISERWMIHYFNSDMERFEWMRDEERRFLADPHSAFPRWDTVFSDIARAIGLDYFALDCSVLPDGSIVVFECGSAMLVHCRDDVELFAYKYEYVPRIFDAFDAMLRRRQIGR